ncbi:MAG: glycosyltransferase, partial [Methanomicrobiales archaeon]|nr:glycosyltransferase [Methanomicrobiales archaeon]
MKLPDYEPIVGKSTIEELRLLASKLAGREIQNVNSTYVGGGVAEILNHMIPILQELGVDARWNVIKGSPGFFEVTKKFHNALHGRKESISEDDFELFLEINRKNMAEMDFHGQTMFIHDPQPCALIEKKDSDGKWIWRCHIDVSNPDERVWRFLERFVIKYDATVFSAPAFSRPLPVRQFLISPSIDPLSDKNKDLSTREIDAAMEAMKIPRDKPIVTQVSRFDYMKDPVGVVRAFELVKRSIDCTLVLVGGGATDDPEGEKVLAEVKAAADGNPDIHIISGQARSDIEINALQRASTVILQKSLKEGFALTVSEALWKGKPVVASAVGGIPLQVRHKLTGLLSHGIDGTAYAVRQLLANPDYARWLGENGKEHVRHNFLITRHVRDYLLLFIAL